MPTPKRVLVLMNLASVGRASMAAVVPVLAACGVQACPLPTTLLSSHLGGFGVVAAYPATPFAEEALAHWQSQGVMFDAIYTGYLPGQEQFLLAQKMFEAYPDAVKIVDPALGDGGKLYSKTTAGMVEQMRVLADQADILTPNLTESALLLGEDPAAVPTRQEVERRLADLSKNKAVVLTSAPVDAATGIAGCMQGNRAMFFAAGTAAPQSYPGTGDLFTAALSGLLLRGMNLQDAARRAMLFVETAVWETYQNQGEARHGVWFEPHLSLLANS